MKLRNTGSNQAVIEFNDGTEILFSYETPVAGFKPGMGHFKTDAFFSVTTSKHVNKYIDGIAPAILSQAQIEGMVNGK